MKNVPHPILIAVPSQGVTVDTVLFEAELAPNQFAERVLDFIMSGNWSLLSVRGIRINIVAAAMSLKIAAGLDQFLQELVPFHTATSICLV